MPVQQPVAAHLAEATYLLLPHDLGVIDSEAVGVLRENVDGYDALLLGPGLTQEEPTIAFVHQLLGLETAGRKGHIGFVAASTSEEPESTDLPPLVVDADGLNALAQAREWWHSLPPETILTPHPGEMARLMGAGASAREVQADREGVVSQMARDWGTIVVLKGAFTVVAGPDGRVGVVPFANAGLATAGSGDVLAGAIVGLRAQGMGAFEAAVAGAYLHGLAGELVRNRIGDMGMVASDLLPQIPRALRRIRHGQTR
jgi:NAD(P)H-hydrate epimerase